MPEVFWNQESTSEPEGNTHHLVYQQLMVFEKFLSIAVRGYVTNASGLQSFSDALLRDVEFNGMDVVRCE